MNILVFTGFSAGGKSSVGRILANRFGYELLDVRQIIHTLAENRGYVRIRDWLAREGIGKLASEYRQELIHVVGMKQDQNGIIVDDIFDKDLLGSIRTSFPEAQVLIVAFDVPEEIREKRMAQRLASTVEEARIEMTLVDGFKKMGGIEEVIKNADIRILNEGLLEDTVTTLGKAVEGLGASYRHGLERV